MFTSVHHFRKDVARDATRPVVLFCSRIEREHRRQGGAVKDGYNLERRVADFAARCLDVCEALPRGRVGVANFKDQLSRSATAVAANYAEASVPASRRDFANKMSIAMKELVESRMWLYIIAKREYIKSSLLIPLAEETDALVRIFNASITTARKRLNADG